MKTIILPGFSIKNKDWANEAKTYLKLDHKIIIHEWDHWKTEDGNNFSTKKEVANILKEIGEDNINILAKSVGTAVAATLIKQIGKRINKIILCGIPSTNEVRYQSLKDFDGGKIVCFQNSLDPFASYKEIKSFLDSINPKIKIIEKPSEDHNYPYFEEFEAFLKQS